MWGAIGLDIAIVRSPDLFKVARTRLVYHMCLL